MKKAITCLLVLFFSTTVAAQSNTPNVIFIMTDDVGYGDLGSYGGPDIRTPVLDRLARDGVRFTDFYSNGPTCSPTRAGLMTGRYQQRYNVEVPLPSSLETAAGQGLNAEGHSLPFLLKTAGYSTGLVGKWHLGYRQNQVPEAHGFDYFFGFKAGFTDYYEHINGEGGPDLWENGELIEEEGYMTDMITERSIRFIREHADAPFFLSIQYNAAHWPYQVPDKPTAAIRNAAHLQPNEDNTSTREEYVAMLERADQGMGEIMDALEQAGIDDETLVIFTNDNGGEWLSRNTPLFNRKWTVWEGGIRVPAIMRWPGVIPANQVSPQVGITMDFTATILALAGVEMPRGYAPEGINLLPIVSGQAPVVERTLFWRASPTNRAVRSGDLKLVMQSPSAAFLFNVREDPGERNDLTNTGQDDIRRLRSLLNEWTEDVDSEGAGRAAIAARQARD
jgi:arylsulfatase A-like enzyme